MNMPTLMSPKLILSNIKKLSSALNPKGPTMTLLNETALQTLLHASEHGDVTLCQRLYEAIGGDTGAVRGGAFKAWVSAHSPITARQDKWTMKKGWKKEDFKLEDAAEKPFWEWAGAERVNTFSAETVLKTLRGLLTRTDNAVEKGTFKGDSVATKAILAEVINLADERAKKLTPEQLGADKGTTEQVILEAAQEHNQDASSEARESAVA